MSSVASPDPDLNAQSNGPDAVKAASPASRANPDFRLVALVAGLAIGAIIGIVTVAVIWPAASAIAGTAITAIAAVAGGAISVGAASMYVQKLERGAGTL
jgi:hypothetical protein